MAPHNELSSGDGEDSSVQIVSYLGPISSYTHQVIRLCVILDTPAHVVGLTDFDLAQAALQSFHKDEFDRHDYQAERNIQGTLQKN